MEKKVNNEVIEILLVEDNEGDVGLVKRIFLKAKVRNSINVVEDGEEAMSFLRKEGQFSDAPRPNIILLDLNLPRKDGREVLKEIKEDDNLRRIPVVVLTTSKSEVDINKAYDLHANCYVNKPVDFSNFIRVIDAIENLWLKAAKLPS